MTATADAAKRVDLGPGEAPSAVVDAAGTAHVVWRPAGGGAPTTEYCRLPRGASACDVRLAIHTVTADLTQEGHPRIVRRATDGALLIVDGRVQYAESDPVTNLVASGDGGATWSPPRLVGRGMPQPTGATLTPDGQAIDLQRDASGSFSLQRLPLSGGVETRLIELSSRFYQGGSLMYLPDGRPLAVLHSCCGSAIRTFTGGDLYAQAAWSPAVPAPLPGKGTAVAGGGPAGLFVLSAEERFGAALRLRRLSSRTLRPGAPVTLRRFTNVPEKPAFAQDARGRLHLAWREIGTDVRRRCRPTGHCLAYRTGRYVTRRVGRKRRKVRVLVFSRTRTLEKRPYQNADVADLELAVGPTGRGVVTYLDRRRDDHVVVRALPRP